MSQPISNLILVGGIFHDFERSALALTDILAPLGVHSNIECDLESGLASLEHRPVDLLTINALRWEMVGEKYDPYRVKEAYCPSAAARRRILQHVQKGGALLGLHTASICFSDWPEWETLLGGKWVWGTSWHPQPDTIEVTLQPGKLLDHLNSFNVTDELYTDLSVSSDATILASGRCERVVDPQPLIWSHTFGNGRVVYNALGHDHESLNHPEHAEALRCVVRWALDMEKKQ